MKTWVKTVASVSALLGMLLLAMGSEDGPGRLMDQTNKTPLPIQHGVMEDGLRIVAVDGSFELKAGQRFQSPFQANLWNSGCTMNSKTLLSNASTALRCGGKNVLVYHDDNTEPLHGVLALNTSIAAAYGPASRSYMIKVPDDKIEHARQGNTVVAYEMMDWKSTKRYSNRVSSFNREHTYYGWILWVSAYPL